MSYASGVAVAEPIDAIFDPKTGLVTFRMFVPVGAELPTGLRISFSDALVLEQAGGARMIEVVGVPERLWPVYDDDVPAA